MGPYIFFLFIHNKISLPEDKNEKPRGLRVVVEKQSLYMLNFGSAHHYVMLLCLLFPTCLHPPLCMGQKVFNGPILINHILDATQWYLLLGYGSAVFFQQQNRGEEKAKEGEKVIGDWFRFRLVAKNLL